MVTGTVSNYIFRLQGFTGGINYYKTGGVYVKSFYDATTADSFQIGFDGANRLQLKRNGTVVWTDKVTTATADYLLYIVMDNESGSPGADNVTYNP